MRWRLLVAAVAAVVSGAGSGCSGARRAAVHDVGPGTVALDGRTGAELDADAAWRELARARVVYVAEVHASPPHQQAQLAVARLLDARGRSVALGIEWLPAEAQPALDRFLAGETDGDTFAADARWSERWGHGLASYLPILRWARERGIPVWALNVPKEVSRAVATGTEAVLEPALRSRVPPLDSANEAHRAWFEGELRALGDAHHPLTDDALARYYRAQLAWDEGMAAALVERLGADGLSDVTAVVLAGAGHVVRGLGIPDRVATATGWPFAVILPVTPADAPREHVRDAPWPEREADLLWLAR